jgi:hypothetical protein
VGKSHIKSVRSKVDSRLVESVHHYVMNNLPIFLDTIDYARLDSLLQPGNLRAHMARQYAQLLAPWSMVASKFIAADPLNLSGNVWKNLEALKLDVQYTLYDEHIFSSDKQYLMSIISPVFGAGAFSNNEAFV